MEKCNKSRTSDKTSSLDETRERWRSTETDVTGPDLKYHACAKRGNLCLDGGEKGGAVLPNQADVSPKCAAVIFPQLGLLGHRKQMEVKQSRAGWRLQHSHWANCESAKFTPALTHIYKTR